MDALQHSGLLPHSGHPLEQPLDRLVRGQREQLLGIGRLKADRGQPRGTARRTPEVSASIY